MNITWTGNGDGTSWSDPANWDAGIVPGPFDTAIINSGTIDLNIDAIVAELNLNDGTLAGEGDLIVLRTFNWLGGTLAGEGTTTVTVDASLNISGTLTRTLDERILINQGVGFWSSTGNIVLNNGAILLNDLGASFTIQDDGQLLSLMGEGSVFNDGLLSKVLGVLTTFSSVNFFNTGTVDVQAGTLSVSGGQFINESGTVIQTTGSLQLSDTTFTSTIAELRATGTPGIFAFAGTSAVAQLEFTLNLNSEAGFTNEIGCFVVDDDQGRINGIAPGTPSYIEAALARAQIVSTVLSNRPVGFTPPTRVLEFASNARIGFYLVSNSSTEVVLGEIAAGETPANIILSTSSNLQISNLTNRGFTMAWEDKPDGGDGDYNDVVMDAQTTDPQTTDDPNSCKLGSELQAGGERELIDLRPESGQLSASYTVNREAEFNNVVGLYRIENEEGAVVDPVTGGLITPDQPGYAQAAIQQRVPLELAVTNQGTTTIQGQLEGGVLYAPYILANTNPTDFLANNPENSADGEAFAYFPFSVANPDQTDHLRILGDNTFGFEDEFNGGDMDYNDLVFTVCVTPN